MKYTSAAISLCCLLALTACAQQAATDYQNEISELSVKIEELHKPATKDDALRLVYYRYLYASLSGDFNDFKATEDAIHAAVKNYGPADDLYYFSAQLNFKLHRLDAALADINAMPLAADSASLRTLRADIALQQGRYAEALQGYETIAAEKRSWDALARLAYYRLKTGQPEEADALYRQAAELISAKDMRSYAWVELQRGLIDLDYARYPQALEHYETANRAWSGYWLIEEHIAEVLALLGRKREAIALYKKIIDRTGNPEFISALAGVLEPDDPAAAAALYRQADAAYAQRHALYPEAALGHWIGYLLEKNTVDPKLLEYAQRNHELRPNAESRLLLAQACLKTGETARAQALIREILQTPWRTPEIDTLAQQIAN